LRVERLERGEELVGRERCWRKKLLFE